MPEVTIPGLTNGQLYGFRIFPRNVKNQYQTIVPGGGSPVRRQMTSMFSGMERFPPMNIPSLTISSGRTM